MNESLMPYDGFYFSPDGPPGGPPAPPNVEPLVGPELPKPQAAIGLLSDIIVRDYVPYKFTGLDIDIEENNGFNNEIGRRAEELTNRWKDQFPGQEMSLDEATAITSEAMNFFKEVGEAPANGKSQGAEDVAKMLAKFDLNLEEKIKSLVLVEDAPDVAWGVTGNLKEFVNDRTHGKNIRGEVTNDDIHKNKLSILQDEASKKAIREAKEAAERRAREEAAYIEEKATALSGLKRSQTKAIRDKVAILFLSGEGNSVPAAAVFDPETCVRLGLDPEVSLPKDIETWMMISQEGYERTEFPQEFIDLRKRLDSTIHSLVEKGGPGEVRKYIQTIMGQLKDGLFLGEFTPELRAAVPLGVNLADYQVLIESYAEQFGLNVDSEGANSQKDIKDFAERLKNEMAAEDLVGAII